MSRSTIRWAGTEFRDPRVLDGFDYHYVVTAVVQRQVTGAGQGPTEFMESPFRAVFDGIVRPRIEAGGSYRDGKVWVVPNPFRQDAPWDRAPVPGDAFTRHVDFMGLPRALSKIRIYTLAGDLVQTITHDGTGGDGEAAWNLISRNGQDIESGCTCSPWSGRGTTRWGGSSSFARPPRKGWRHRGGWVYCPLVHWALDGAVPYLRPRHAWPVEVDLAGSSDSIPGGQPSRRVLAQWLRSHGERGENRGALVHWHSIPARAARFGELQPPLPEALAGALSGQGITRLYTHQVCAIEALRAGRDTVVVTGTASGKSLCFHLPALERLLDEPGATALYLFPTKALAQDQLKSLTRLAEGDLELSSMLRAGVYDGDTAATTRRKLREEANVILSNPDMLHAGILPQHAKWARFLRNLRYVVGGRDARLPRYLRQPRRAGAAAGSNGWSATTAASSATCCAARRSAIPANSPPRSPAATSRWWTTTGRHAARSTSRSGTRRFATRLASSGAAPTWKAARSLAGLLENGAQAIAFTKSRVSAELVYRYTREQLERSRPRAAGGDARQPELATAAARAAAALSRRLPARGAACHREGAVLGRAARGGEHERAGAGHRRGRLDAAVLVGAAPTLASIWQQAGRAGRSGAPSLVVLVAYNDTVDQYLMRRPQFLFGRPTEAACVDPHNPYILAQQLACAAYELPIGDADAAAFGAQMHDVLAKHSKRRARRAPSTGSRTGPRATSRGQGVAARR